MYKSSISFINVTRKWALVTVIFTLFSTLSFSQDYQIYPEVCDSLSPTSFFIHVNGFASFTDSTELHVELVTNDTLATVVYSGTENFIDTNYTLTNFTYDSTTNAFSFDIGNYTSNNYLIHLWSEVAGEMREELIIETF